MPIELGQTGGNRPSRSSRSPTANVADERPQIARQDVARQTGPVMDGFASGLDAVNRSLSAFFPALEQLSATSHEEEMRRIETENTDYMLKLESDVKKDPEAAREAMITGDYSKFIPEDAMRSRRVIANTFKSLVATQMADEDYNAGVKDAIMDTPMDGDPDEAVRAHIKANTDGADPLFASVYGNRLGANASKQVQEWRNKRLEYQQKEAGKTATAALTEDIGNGNFQATPEHIKAFRARIAASLPMNGPQAVAEAEAIVHNTLIREAAKGSAIALQALEVPDPEHPGKLSYSQKEPGAYEKALKQYHEVSRAAKHANAFTDYDEINRRIAALAAGVPEVIGTDAQGRETKDSMADIYAAVKQFKDDYGDGSAQYTDLLKALPKVTAGQAERSAMINMAASGLTVTGKQSEINKLLDDKGGTIQAIASAIKANNPNMPANKAAAAAVVRYNQMVAHNGRTENQKTSASDVLMAGSDPSQAMEVYSETKALWKLARGTSKESLLTPEARAIFTLMMDAEESGGDPMRIREDFRTALGNSPQIKPAQWMNNHLVGDPEDRRGSAVSKKKEMAKKAANNVDVPEHLRVPGSLWGTNKVKWDNIPHSIRLEIHEAANNMLIAMDGAGKPDPKKAYELAVKSVLASKSVNKVGDEYVVAENLMPKLVLDRNGQPQRPVQIDASTVDRFNKSLNAEGNKRMLAAINAPAKDIGFSQDSLTTAGEGVAVNRKNEAGYADHTAVSPNAVIRVPTESVQGTEGEFFKYQPNPDGTTNLVAPPAPKPGEPRRIYVEPKSNFHWSWDDSMYRWSLRYSEIDGENYLKRKSFTDVRQVMEQQDRAGMEVGDIAGQVRKAGPRTLRRALDITTAERQGQVELGSPAVPDGYAPPLLESKSRGIAKARGEILDALQERGRIDGDERLRLEGQEFKFDDSEDDWRLWDKEVDKSIDFTFKNGRSELDDLKAPLSKRTTVAISNFIKHQEGSSATIYDDAKPGKQKWIAGKSRGHPTIGYGFNLNRPDADKLLKQVGFSKKEALQFKPMTAEQQEDLLRLGMKDSLSYIRKTFKDTPLAQHQLIALASLAYNSAWDDKGPKLIGPKLREYIKAGDLQAAANEIRNRSNVTKNKGLQRRREAEADMFLGLDVGEQIQ